MRFKDFTPLFFLLAFCACVKDKPVVQSPSRVEIGSRKVYVVNEGTFHGSNATVSLYDPSGKQVVESYFTSVNNLPLGDIAQSMNTINGNYYIVVNNSGKVVVCDENFRKTGEVTGLTSPR